MKDPRWRADAACRGLPPSLWFPDLGQVSTEARAVCAGCPVKDPCLDYALWHCDPQPTGIWAGTTERERRWMRTRVLTTGQSHDSLGA